MDAGARLDQPAPGPWRAEVPMVTGRPFGSGRRTARGGPAAQASWRFLCLAEIGNFAALRRHLGRSRSDLLAVDVAARIAQVLPDARLAVAGRALVDALAAAATKFGWPKRPRTRWPSRAPNAASRSAT